MADILRKQGRNIGSSGGSGGGGLTEEEHDWLESLAAYEPNMWDINPNLVADTGSTPPGADAYSIYVPYRSTLFEFSGVDKFPVCGYKRIKVWGFASVYNKEKFRFQFADNSFGQTIDFVSGWSDWITVPENAIGVQFAHTNSNGNMYMYYALSTSES